jgi:hypothetical protein
MTMNVFLCREKKKQFEDANILNSDKLLGSKDQFNIFIKIMGSCYSKNK